jgi:hypothetical protein
VIRFGTIINIDRKFGFAIIRENTPAANEFIVLNSELLKVPSIDRFCQVTFYRDSEFVCKHVAKTLGVIRLGKVA